MRHNYPHILAALRSEPWFITDAAFNSIADLVLARVAGGVLADAGGAAPASSDEEQDAPPEPVPSVAVIRCHGILGKNLGLMERACGGVDYDALVEQIAKSAATPGVENIVVSFSTPGGHAIGCAEAFDAICDIRAQFGRPILGFVGARCCSAGMYLAGACDGILATRTAELGSIGCMLTLEDRSGANDQARIKRYTIKSATMKDIGNPDRAPTPEELSTLQARVDYLGGIFRADMQSARPQISPEVYEKGLTYMGAQAVTMGLADELVPSLAAVVASLSE